MRRSAIVAIVASLLAAASPARADNATKQRCADAHASAQGLRKQGHLVDARAALLTCSNSACPAVIVAECGPMLEAVEVELPSVVVAVQAGGVDVLDAKVTLDGAPLAGSLDGRPRDVDPGEHVFRWERDGGKPVEQRIVLRVGERARRIVLSVDAVVEPVAPATRPIPPAFWALGAVGVVALAVGAGFEISGLHQRSSLAATKCNPGCNPSDVNSITRSFLVGDITLGLGIASLVAAGVVFAVRPTVSRPSAGFVVLPLVVPRDHGATLAAEGSF